MNISASGCLPGMSHEVRLRKAQTGLEVGIASLSQRISVEEVSSDTECSLCPGDDQICRCFHQGRQEVNRMRELRRDFVSARCKMGFDRYAT